jgi:hypothetical protein
MPDDPSGVRLSVEAANARAGRDRVAAAPCALPRLGAGESASATFRLRPGDFEIYDVVTGGWRPASARFAVRVAKDSRDPGVERTLDRE